MIRCRLCIYDLSLMVYSFPLRLPCGLLKVFVELRLTLLDMAEPMRTSS